MVLDSAFYRPVVLPISRQRVWICYLVGISDVAIRGTRRLKIYILANFILLRGLVCIF